MTRDLNGGVDEGADFQRLEALRCAAIKHTARDFCGCPLLLTANMYSSAMGKKDWRLGKPTRR